MWAWTSTYGQTRYDSAASFIPSIVPLSGYPDPLRLPDPPIPYSWGGDLAIPARAQDRPPPGRRLPSAGQPPQPAPAGRLLRRGGPLRPPGYGAPGGPPLPAGPGRGRPAGGLGGS